MRFILKKSILAILILFVFISCQGRAAVIVNNEIIEQVIEIEEVVEEIEEELIVEIVDITPVTFAIKSAPPDLRVFLNDELLSPISSSSADGLRNYRIRQTGIMRFSADGYKSLQFSATELPVRRNIASIKLENENGIAQLKGEYRTGIQPKSAYFTPDGQRLIVPLLGQHGVDVFKQANGLLTYEKRLTVPESRSPAFVEVMFDEKRREFWVSNMQENRVHLYDLDTLEFKTSLNVGGIFPKVIVQSPDGSITVVSNWVSMDISVFDSETKVLQRRIPVGGTPRGMAFSPDGSLLYTAIYDAPLIAVVDMTTNRVTKRYRLYDGWGAARHIIYHNGHLYVSDMGRGTVNIVDAETGALLRSQRVGPNLNTIILTPCKRYVFASSRGTNNPVDYTLPGPDFGAVYMLNAEDLSLIERIWGRNQPTGLDVSPDGKLLVFTDFLDENLQLYWLPN
ncbi:MAG: YncE family protein [Treponema sp.]|jgi:DNA-binding beta-propeller fold protein YncE/Trp operon repressor|nr:YncE family protein [Treponema sp.]